MQQIELDLLYQDQLKNFELAASNYHGLQQVLYRDIPLDGFNIRLQFNPARIISTNAKIDADTLKQRSCFLCPQNMPTAQRGISYNEHYNVFINPYPIFAPHFTIPSRSHEPQLLGTRMEDMLNIAFDFPDYTIFYNGPSCGASAPDHFHFQLVPRHQMPLETDIAQESIQATIVRKDFYHIYKLQNYLRETIILQASDQKLLCRLFSQVQKSIGQHVAFEEEPMFNLLCWFDNCQWTLCIFPRKTRRPWQFFAEGAEKIMFSPGCVDMAGLIITPRREDFDKYSAELLADLFHQVSIEQEVMLLIFQDLQKL